MPHTDIIVHHYLGTLAAADILAGQNTYVLNVIGGPQAGMIVDNDGVLEDGDDGVSTFNGYPVNYIGSGTMQAGIAVGPLIVGIGPMKDVVVFEANGQIWFHFPDGPPSWVGMIVMIGNITPAPYDLFDPVCFCKGTQIRTPSGDRLIESLKIGDLVLDRSGKTHEIRWIGDKARKLPVGLSRDCSKWFPVRIRANAFGPGLPERELRVSQQHRIELSGALVELLIGTPRALAPAKALIGDGVAIDRSKSAVHYFHILLDEHAVLLANGLPCESLLPGEQAENAVGTEAWAEITEIFPELGERLGGKVARPAAPILKTYEARLFRPEHLASAPAKELV